MDIVPKSKFEKSGGVVKVASDIVAVELINKLFQDHPFAECNVTCDTCGYTQMMPLQTISIEKYKFKLGLADAVGKVLQSKMSHCDKPCSGYREETTTLKSK